MSRFEEILEQASIHCELDKLRRQMTPDEAKIAVQYLRSLVKNRPKSESRAHMAVFELENDPK